MSHSVQKRGNRLENRIESRPMTPDSRVNIHDTSRSFTYTNNDVLERTLLYLHYFDDIETNIIRISVIINESKTCYSRTFSLNDENRKCGESSLLQILPTFPFFFSFRQIKHVFTQRLPSPPETIRFREA